MPTSEDMYRCIEAERARNEWTIAEFAEKIGVYEKTYRDWKTRLKPLTSTTLINMADVFDCSVDYLLGLTDKIKPNA